MYLGRKMPDTWGIGWMELLYSDFLAFAHLFR